MKRYFLDTEFNGFGGELISLALVCEDGRELYLASKISVPIVPWVAENVMPIIGEPEWLPKAEWPHKIAAFFQGEHVEIVSDWPDDIRYLCASVITGPGQIANIRGMTLHVVRIDAYPTKLKGAVQHNALWDARALMAALLA